VEKKQETNYITLQLTIDKVVGQLGILKTISLLESFVGKTTIGQGEHKKNKIISQYLVGAAIKEFDLHEELFYVSHVREYRDARMCCFHLLRKYTQDTLPKIGLTFQCSERSVEYGCTKVSERLAHPKGYVKFVSAYQAIEIKLLEFIGKIN